MKRLVSLLVVLLALTLTVTAQNWANGKIEDTMLVWTPLQGTVGWESGMCLGAMQPDADFSYDAQHYDYVHHIYIKDWRYDAIWVSGPDYQDVVLTNGSLVTLVTGELYGTLVPWKLSPKGVWHLVWKQAQTNIQAFFTDTLFASWGHQTTAFGCGNLQIVYTPVTAPVDSRVWSHAIH